MLEVYRGSVNTWECDENQHLNVRFYTQKLWEAVANFAPAIGLTGAFKARAESTLLPIDMHIRYLKELHDDAGLSIRAGVSSIGDNAATLFFEMLHNDGTPAATFTMLAAHCDPRTTAPLPWSDKTLKALESYACPIPPHGAPRSIDMARAPSPDVNRARAESLNAPVTGRYAVGAEHCDVFGRMRAEFFIGRVSESMPNVRIRTNAKTADPARQIGGAALEYRMTFRGWPSAGDLLETRSSIVDAAGKTRRLAHWLLDPISGNAWASAEVVAIMFDMQTRKSIEMSDAEREAIMANAIPEMGR